MKFLDMELENFMSYRDPQVLPLADLGLVLVNGENRVSNCADSNFVGKTGIFDGLSWGAFGVTLRGLRADDVACRFTKGRCRVKIRAEDGGKVWEIERTRRPAALVFGEEGSLSGSDEGSAAMQERVDRLLGFGFRTFKHAVVFSQGAFERFALANQADQLRMIDEIQNLDFSGPLDRAKNWRDKANARLSQIDRDLAVKEASRKAGADQIKSLELELEFFASHKKQNLAVLEADVEAARKSLDAAIVDLAGLQDKRSRLPEANRQADILTAKTADWKNLTGDVYRTDVDFKAAQKAERDLSESVQALAELKECPKCRSPIAGKGKSADELRTRFKKDIDNAVYVAELARQKLVLATDRKDALKREIDDETSNLLGWLGLGSVDEFKKWKESCSDTVLDKERRVNQERTRAFVQAEETLAKERFSEWTGKASLYLARQTLAEAEGGISKLTEERIKVDEAFRMAEYWVEAFGDRGIRSLMFDSVAHFLNERLAHHLERLSAGESEVTLSALSALKKGGMKEKLSISASWDVGAGLYLAQSGGQTRRVDLALFGSIQDLAEMRSARPFPLKVWDEAGDSLDTRGKELFAEWVREEAKRRGTGFVITHDREFGEMLQPDHVWTVVLDENGSRVEMS